jgi:hypothetical protein
LMVFQTSTRVQIKKKQGKCSGKQFSAVARALAFFYEVVLPSPYALEVAGKLEKEGSRDGRSGYNFGAGLTGCDGGIDERPR